MNITGVLFFEKILAIAYLFIPESLLFRTKATLRKVLKRSESLNSTKSYFSNRIKKGMNNMDMVYRSSPFQINDKIVLEFGTGGHGIDMILFYLLGSKKIYTIDLEFFGLLSMPIAIRDFEEFLDVIIEQFNLNKSSTIERYNAIKDEKNISTLMSTMNIEFLTFKQITKSGDVIADRVDFFFSESNLQRIPIKQIFSIFDQIAKKLNDGAAAFHRVDCSDISVQKTRPVYAGNLWPLNYLKHSQLKWNLITTNRFGSQNRLRQSQFMDMFKNIGFQTRYIENYYSKSSDIDKMRNFQVDKMFAGISPENLAITSFRFVSLKSNEKQELEEKSFVTNGKFGPANSVWSPEHGLIQTT